MDADPALVAELLALETDLLRPDVRRSRAALEGILAPDFTEIGRSGRTYDREEIVAALAAAEAARAGEPAAPVAAIEGFAVRILAPGVALATYRTVGGGPAGAAGARRSSVWRRDADGAWRLAFHQGTPAARR